MPERQVVFYECQNVEDQDDFDCVAALSGVNDLDDEDWRVSDYDGVSEFGVIVDRVGDATKSSRLRFLRIRQDTPFVLSAARKLSPVQVEEDERISEFTHVVMWPDGFLGAISSREAPSHKRLSLYFEGAAEQHTHIVNLFDPDAIRRLKELKKYGLRNVKVKLRNSEIKQIEEDEGVRGFGNLLTAGKGTQAVTIGIELGVGRGHSLALDPEVAAGAVELAEMGDQLESMVVRGRDKNGDIQTINMKKERVSAAVDIPEGANNARTYRAIRDARKIVEKRIGGLNRAARGS
jgi:hypothetical protein